MARLSPVLAIALAFACLLLSGCLKYEGDMTVHSDNTVSGSVTVGIARAAITSTGVQVAVSAQLDSPKVCAALTPSATATNARFTDDDYIGVTCTFGHVPIADIGGGAGSDLSLIRTGDLYRLLGSLDMSAILSNALLTDFGIDPATILRDADVSMRFTFPGTVHSGTGAISGDTIVFTLAPGQTTLSIAAIAAAEGSTSRPFPLLGKSALIVVVLAAAVAGGYALRRHRPSGSPVTAPSDVSHFPPAGPVQYDPFAASPTMPGSPWPDVPYSGPPRSGPPTEHSEP
jgi:hypothetical protein